jgi:hypothetical protein
MLRRLIAPALFAVTAAVASAQGPGRPMRDTPSQQKDAPEGPQGRITGRVVAADNGRPVKRARVFATASELSEGRGALTDDNGAFELIELPAGRYTLTASKAGFVSLSYGQRRPLQAGTPLQLADGQQLRNVEFALPRGSVIAGHVTDQDGDPMPGTAVRVMRYQYQQGDRRLAPAGNAQTDDRGQYRIWGLMPGEYYVNAIVRNPNLGARIGAFAAAAGRGGGRGGAQAAAAGSPAGEEESLAYAPTYYPGVPSINEARAVTVGLGQEMLDIDFTLQLVRTSRVAGRVTNPDGTPTTSGTINLLAESAAMRGGQIGSTFGARIQWDGAFSIVNVPPGRYVLRARGDDTVTPQFATEPLSVGEGDIGNLSVVLMPSASISGSLAFPPTQTAAPDLTQVRVSAPALEAGVQGQGNTRVEKDGTFKIEGVAAGPHLIRPAGGLRGWSLKSIVIDGRDVTDTPIDLRSGQNLAGVAITFTDLQTQIGGAVTNEQGAPVTDYTVLAFTTNSTYWRPLSRHIMTARPDQTGTFTIRGLPADEYYLTTVDPTEQGEWFDAGYLEDHRAGAARVTVNDGETKTQDFRIRTR